jgi:hypothetical protein
MTSRGRKQLLRIAFGPEALKRLNLEVNTKILMLRGTDGDDGLVKLRRADAGRKLCAWQPPSPQRAGWATLSCASRCYAPELERLPDVDETEAEARACENGDVIVKLPSALRRI